MGDELNDVAPRKIRNYSEIFDECFPFYLSIGMSSAEYWCGDSDLPQYFRKAFKMRQEHENHQAWMHGLYVYDAVLSAMSHLSPKKSEHKQYAAKPYSFGREQTEEATAQEVEKAQAQAEVWMKAWASATQKQFKK